MRLKKLYPTGLALILTVTGLLCINPQTAFAAGPFTCTWTGGGSDSNFNTAANWSGCNGAAPQPADSNALIFPLSASNRTPFNNLTSAVFGSITFTGTASSSGYTINGNSLTANTIVDNSTNSFDDTVNSSSVQLTSTATINGGANSHLTITTLGISGALSASFTNVTIGEIAGGGFNSTLNINQDVIINGIGGHSLGGSVIVAGELTLDSPINIPVTVNSGGMLKGAGGNISDTTLVHQGGTIAPGHSPGCLTTTTISISGTYQEEIGGANTACTDYDQLIVTNTVNITNGTLDTSLVNSFTPTIGQTFKIIDNQGISPVLGTFSGLPEGTTFSTGGYDFKISYVGGDGNDVILTALGITPPPAAPATPAPAAPNTGLAAVRVHPFATLAITTISALMMIVIARRLRPVKEPA